MPSRSPHGCFVVSFNVCVDLCQGSRYLSFNRGQFDLQPAVIIKNFNCISQNTIKEVIYKLDSSRNKSSVSMRHHIFKNCNFTFLSQVEKKKHTLHYSVSEPPGVVNGVSLQLFPGLSGVRTSAGLDTECHTARQHPVWATLQ